jgi:hypothetical protein
LFWRFKKHRNCPSYFFSFFFHGSGYVLILSKNELGYISGDFFTNSSGHLGPNLHFFFFFFRNQWHKRLSFLSLTDLLQGEITPSSRLSPTLLTNQNK